MLLTAALSNPGERPNMTVTYVRFSEMHQYMAPSSGELLLKSVNRLLPQDRQLDADDEVSVTHGPYLRWLGKQLEENLESETLRGYVAILLARYLAPLASSSLVSAQLPKEGNAAKTVLIRIGHCVLDATMMVSYGLGDLFVRWHLKRNELAQVRHIVERVRNATREGFQKLDWIDERTRTEAVKRVNRLASLVGQPDNLTRLEQLNQHYFFLSQRHHSYAPMLTAARDAAMERTRSYLKSTEPYFPAINVELPMILVNAFYVPIYHVMVIPPAIMFAPFYRDGVPEALNYGSLGHVVGHEITHAFDRQLGLYNESGLEDDWWSAGSLKRFNASVACLRRLYNSVAWGQGFPYGDTAFSENFADCGGMEKAYRAFKNLGMQPSHMIGQHLYTADQLFFISSCYKWCNSERTSKQSSDDDGQMAKVYSPMRMRCNVPLMNMPQFAAEFKCAPGSTMNPGERCSVF